MESILMIEDTQKVNDPNSSYNLFGYRGIKGGDKNILLRALFFIRTIPITINSDHNEVFFQQSAIINIPI
ncbi:hypothetical protein MXB_599 [Myxobolus squamalis]|nr:hypothetical protein MXB_599 [Myxobolus squamalis]